MWKLALLGLLSLFRATHQQYYPPNHHSEDDHDDAKLNSTVNGTRGSSLRCSCSRRVERLAVEISAWKDKTPQKSWREKRRIPSRNRKIVLRSHLKHRRTSVERGGLSYRCRAVV
eukprot:scaffold7710_cov277-Pinguiococcus_pyrenoidosus.AAC.5